METIIEKPELACRVIDFIKECQGEIYNRKLSIKYRNGVYKANFELNNWDVPLSISGQFVNDDEFFCYLCEELKNRRLFTTNYNIVKTKKP